MPEISRFYGIVIQMYFRDHRPPHFHARYGGKKAVVDINKLEFVEGRLPPTARRLVIEWASKHQRQLNDAWDRAEQHQDPGKIAPLT